MKHELVNPSELGPPRGYANGVLAAPGRFLFVAGQIGWDQNQVLVSEVFSRQFRRALENVMTVVRAAGGQAEHVVRLTVYVTDKQEYLAQLKEIGAGYRELMKKHYVAMSLVEVKDLLERGAKVEIEATAVLPTTELEQ